MLSVLLWKEYREHRLVWAALAFVAAGSLLFLPFVMAPGGLESRPDVRYILHVLVVALSWTYGLTCGAMLLASEREAGTLAFLDGLPGFRWRLWSAKFLAGLFLVLTQIVLVMIAAAATHLFVSGTDAAWMLNALFWSGLYGLAWGMLFSSFGRNVMNMILLALAAQVGAFLVTSLLAAFLAVLSTMHSGDIGDPTRFWGQVAAGVALLSIAPALAGSAFLFTRLDRGRLQPLRIVVPSTSQGVPGWRPLFWLTCLKAFGFALGMAIFALVTGVLIPLLGPMVWPAATLVVGILCGATAFNDERQGLFGDLGNQRRPLFRLWTVKVGVRLILALTATALMTTPLFGLRLVHWEAFSAEFLGLAIPWGQALFLTMGLVYGFCVGVLCGLLFRGLLASAVMALLMSLLLAAIWAPSLLAYGLHLWQPLGPPILLLAATPLLLRPWAASQIASWTTVKRLAPFVLFIGLWIVAGLWVRVYEIPNIPNRIDLAAYRAALPTGKENQGGELVRSACADFSDLYSKITGQYWPVTEPAEGVLDHGWSDGETRLAAWLDKMSAGAWLGMLKEASELPPGVVEDMRTLTEANYSQNPQASRDITLVLAAHGLQRQAAGDDEAFVESLRIGLSLSRAMRQRAPLFGVQCGRENEATLLKALDRWLERLHGRPDLLHQALDALSQYAEATANIEEDQDLMEDVMVKNSIEDPIPSLQSELGRNPYAPVQNFDVRMESQWIAAAWRAPWEHERQQRALRVLFWGDEAQRMALAMNNVGPCWWFPYNRGKPNTLTNLALERAGILKLALRWYQADHGKPAENLDKLVPKYLPSIPLDPYNGKPFGYRLSRGEEIVTPLKPNANPPAPTTRKIPPGQGVLSSVGGDHVFLVPLPPKAK